MKLSFRIFLWMSLVPLFAAAQLSKQDDSVLWVIKSRDGKSDIKAHHIIMSSFQIEKMDVLDVDQIKQRFGDIPEKSVLLVKLKSDANLLPLKDFFEKRKIDFNHYPTIADGEKITDITKFYIDENSLQEVAVERDSIRITTNSFYIQQHQKANKAKAGYKK
ncbi:hypothetical protein [Mucilaginibacter segetis]|uniref:Uncharacterized protein n=1 Tax=Mucilaginibacter segetis TaxID=2793071 RepID=A0A934PU65_9SPHI|nr:hypothetical protein [Mucilaginibacter segetis]MBK0379632.1 hypothetical protein [Mucilaginibacter segetis]